MEAQYLPSAANQTGSEVVSKAFPGPDRLPPMQNIRKKRDKLDATLFLVCLPQYYIKKNSKMADQDQQTKAQTLFDQGKVDFKNGLYDASVSKLGEACQLL